MLDPNPSLANSFANQRPDPEGYSVIRGQPLNERRESCVILDLRLALSSGTTHFIRNSATLRVRKMK